MTGLLVPTQPRCRRERLLPPRPGEERLLPGGEGQNRRPVHSLAAGPGHSGGLHWHHVRKRGRWHCVCCAHEAQLQAPGPEAGGRGAVGPPPAGVPRHSGQGSAGAAWGRVLLFHTLLSMTIALRPI